MKMPKLSSCSFRSSVSWFCLETFMFLDLASRRCNWNYCVVGFDFVVFIFIVYELILDLNKYMYGITKCD